MQAYNLSNIEPPPHDKKRILLFGRAYLIQDFQDNVRPLEGEFEFRFLTDGSKKGVADTRSRFYHSLETALAPEGFSSQDELEIITRCRYLRNLPREQALKMLRSMASVLQEELDQFKPHMVFAQMVDEYSTHLLSELANRRNIIYIGYSYSYFPGKVQVAMYSHGRSFDFRIPSEEEAQETFVNISPQTFRQNYRQANSYTRINHIKQVLRYRVKKYVFRFLAWYEQDPLNLHYGCLPYVGTRRYWKDYPTAKHFDRDWRRRLEKSGEKGAQPIIYLPLGYSPESTIDYWVEDIRFINYEDTILEICEVLGRQFRVAVKEHIHMFGARDINFYKRLRKISNVINIPPTEYSNNIVNVSDAVLVGAGSAGVESFIRSKPIFSYCNRSYWFSHAQATFVDMSHLSKWPLLMKEKIENYSTPSEGEKIEMVRNCLRSTMRLRKPGRVWPLCNTQDLYDLLKTATTLTQSSIVTQAVGRVS